MSLELLGFCKNKQLENLIYKENTIHKITLKNNKTLKIMIIDP